MSEDVQPESDEQTEPTPDPETPEAKQLAEIKRRNALVFKLHNRYLEAKEEATARKKEWEGAAESLQRYIESLDGEPMPLFDQPKAEAEAWRATPILTLGEFGLSGKVCEKLAEADIATLGDLADFSKTARLEEIDGIGPAAAERIDEALTQFWAANPPEPAPVTDDQIAAAVEQAEAAKAGDAGGPVPVACNVCNAERDLAVQPLCGCGCPEFRHLGPVEDSPRPKRKGKAKAEARA